MSVEKLSRTDLENGVSDISKKIAALETEMSQHKATFASMWAGYEKEKSSLSSKLGQYQSEVSKRESRDNIEPTITDHALLRYIERVHGIDVEAMKSWLLNDAVKSAVVSGAASCIQDGLKFVIKGSSVVTVVPTKLRNPKRFQSKRPPELDEISEGIAEYEAASVAQSEASQ